jgi:hypothetical protein
MARKKKLKLNLRNNRGSLIRPSVQVFDSIDEGNIMAALKREPIQSTKGSGPFLAKAAPKSVVQDPRMLKDPHITSRGDYFEIAEYVQRRPTSVNYESNRVDNYFDVHRNVVKSVYKLANTRPRLNTPAMDKVMSRGAGVEVIPGVYDRVKRGEVEGPPFPESDRPMGGAVTEAANTQYNVEQWYEGRYATRPPDIIFSMANLKKKHGSSKRGDEDPTSRPLTREEITVLREREEKRHQSPFARVAKWDDIKRFQPLVPEEPYKKGGLGLPADFDAKSAWGKPVTISSAPRTPKEFPAATADISRSYNIDVGPKASTGQQVLQSPITYRAAFSGKSAGFDFSQTSSDVGPGKYADAYPPAIKIKEPNKASLFFRRADKVWPKDPLPDSELEPIKFGQGSRAFHFPTAGGKAPSWIRQEAIKGMVQKMHPQLARIQYPPVHRRIWKEKKLIK